MCVQGTLASRPRQTAAAPAACESFTQMFYLKSDCCAARSLRTLPLSASGKVNRIQLITVALLSTEGCDVISLISGCKPCNDY